MANTKSALKRIRQNKVRNDRNKYYHKSARTAIKNLRNEEDKEKATEMYPKVCSIIDKLAKRNIIHKNNAGNLKSKLAKKVSLLGA